jgi:dolichol-phosphate mannosyltransferase
MTRALRALSDLPVPRLARFALVGAMGVGVNSVALFLLKENTVLPLVFASAIAIEIAIWNNYFLNDGWTFSKTPNRRPWWTRVAAFHVTAAVAAAINISLLLALVSHAGLNYVIANLIAIAMASTVNYSASALWTWRPAAPAARSPSMREPQPASSRSIVVVPTYNEVDNVARLIDAVLANGSQYEMLVVDDASPDGTGDVVAALAQKDRRVHLLRRPGKLGLATAYIDGFQEALRLGAGLVFQMDADFSHDPADLPKLAAAASTADVAIGSRYVPGGRAHGWAWYRHLVSLGTSLAYRACLGIKLHDVTGGFKCWRRQVLEALPLADVRSRGFAFQIEMNYLCWQAGYSLREVPVTFIERRQGYSKMSLAISLEAMGLLWKLAFGTPRLIARDAALSRSESGT